MPLTATDAGMYTCTQYHTIIFTEAILLVTATSSSNKYLEMPVQVLCLLIEKMEIA
jgi:hypothetical protein